MEIGTLADWNPWWEKKESVKSLTGVRRSETDSIDKFASQREIKIITGVRRSGKSTILYQLVEDLLRNGVEPKNLLFVNFEDKKIKDSELDDIFSLYERKLCPERKIYVFLDEIQNAKDWSPWIRKKYDTLKNISFIITGSSSHLLEKEYSTLLTGRNIKFEITPLNFIDFLSFKNFSIKDIKVIASSTRSRLLGFLDEYLEYGGFPEIVLKEKTLKHSQLNQYFDDIINKDVVARYDLSSIKAFDLAKYLLSNVGNLFSFRTARNFTKLGMETLEKYLSKILDTYLVFLVPIFSYSIKDQSQYPRKIYCIDNGLKNLVSFRFSEDIGRSAENAVFTELKRRHKEPVHEIYYWKNQKHMEVDFIIKHGLKVEQAIQVCWDIKNEKTKEREVKGLLACLEEFKLKEGLIITEDFESEEKSSWKTIKYIPLWKWLLEK